MYWVCGCLNLVTNRCIQILVDLIIGTSYKIPFVIVYCREQDFYRLSYGDYFRFPNAIAIAKSASDIQKVVMFARKHNLHLTVRSSGHDYAGRSTWEGRTQHNSYKTTYIIYSMIHFIRNNENTYTIKFQFKKKIYWYVYNNWETNSFHWYKTFKQRLNGLWKDRSIQKAPDCHYECI